MAQKFVTTEYDLRGKVGPERGLRIALVSDLHEMDPGDVLGRLNDEKPDVIFVAGDTFERHGRGCDPRINQEGSFKTSLKLQVVGIIKTIVYALVGNSRGCPENSYRFLREASQIAPIFLGLGNHEWYLADEDQAVLEETGSILLDNADCEWDGFRIGGMSSIPDEEWLERFRAKEGIRILISHHPELHKEYRLEDFDLVLSGHAHGGQWRIGGRGLFASRQGILPKYTHGVHGNMVISAGCSNTSTIPRFGNPCELVIIRI